MGSGDSFTAPEPGIRSGLTGLIDVLERYYSSRAGEGIIFDLRQQMYSHLSSMALRFFTYTKSGEVVSRFNSDVVGAQNAWF